MPLIFVPFRSTEFAFITSSSWLSSGSDPPRDNGKDWDEDQEDWLEKHVFLSFAATAAAIDFPGVDTLLPQICSAGG